MELFSSFFSGSQERALLEVVDERNDKACPELGLNVLLLSSDTYKDVNDTQFTMYDLQVTSEVNKNTWNVHRRYSQFDELKNRMEKIAGYKEAIKGIVFPGKVYINKTAPSVVEERKNALTKWINALLLSPLSTHYQLNSFLEAVDDNVLEKDKPLPQFEKWLDVSGKLINSADVHGPDDILIVSAASYWTYQALTMVADKVFSAMREKHPNLKVVQLGISELRLVPKNFQDKVRPLLNMLVKSVQKKIPANTTLVFVPDWDGSYIQTFGLKDCDWTWSMWIIYRGVVRLRLRSSTADATAKCVSALDGLLGGEEGGNSI